MTTEYEIRRTVETLSREPWNESVAECLAAERGIAPLTPAHWRLIHTLRLHFLQYGALPPMRFACDISQLGPHCVDKLFHSPQEAWRIAGLPDPGEEVQGYSYPGEMVQ